MTLLDDPATTADAAAGWMRDNQRYLVLHAESVAAALDGRADADESRMAADHIANDVLFRTGRPVAAATVGALFGLTRFELDLLVGTAAAELGLPAATGPVTFGRALAALPDPHWSAVLPDAPLRGWQLVEPHPDPTGRYGGLAQSPLVADERVVHALLGADTLDGRLAGRAQVVGDTCALPPGQLEMAARLATLLRPGVATEPIAVTGQDLLTRRQVAVTAAAAIGLRTLAVDAVDLPADPPICEAFARLLAREVALGNRLLLVEAAGSGDGRERRLLRAVATYGAFGVLSIDEPAGLGELASITVPAPTQAERRELFAVALGDAATHIDPADLADRHPLTPAGVAQAVERALNSAGGSAPDIDATARALVARSVDGLARLHRPAGRLGDLVLPDSTTRPLAAMLAHVRQRGTVLGEWGYAARRRGLAVTALFAGPSGTGKTSAAEAVAAELGVDVVAADLSQVMSKYLGDTEKHLARLFDAAEQGAVLLFDEADALFARRTQVHDSRDRYANLEVAYLLSRLDDFAGIAILTTNARESIDSAFLRRLRFVVNFPFPEAADRARIWAGAFPAAAPTDGLSFERLAQLSVSGATIAQLAMHAAFLAADAGEPIRMRHVLDATRTEFDKVDRPLPAQEIRGWTVE